MSRDGSKQCHRISVLFFCLSLCFFNLCYLWYRYSNTPLRIRTHHVTKMVLGHLAGFRGLLKSIVVSSISMYCLEVSSCIVVEVNTPL